MITTVLLIIFGFALLVNFLIDGLIGAYTANLRSFVKGWYFKNIKTVIGINIGILVIIFLIKLIS